MMKGSVERVLSDLERQRGLSNTHAVAPERNREIPTMLDELDESVDRLSNTLVGLMDKLQPALSEVKPCGTSSDDRASSCVIASRLIATQNKVDAMTSIIHDAMDRLEL